MLWLKRFSARLTCSLAGIQTRNDLISAMCEGKWKMGDYMKIRSRYLVFPVNTLAVSKRLNFNKNDKTVYTLDIQLDNIAPDYYAYVDVSRFIGQELELSVDCDMPVVYRETEEIDVENIYTESMRPQIHFSAKMGWINDPNGLVYLNGVYHMFYQYNPAGLSWANMHWGHAQSKDLMHWEEKNIALFPDERGAMFSGSAVVDEDDRLSKNAEGNRSVLLFYTTTEPFCQRLSYSLDGFKTIIDYDKEAIVPHIEAGNRDPKVVFCDELNCYIMALYLDKSTYCLLSSDDFVNWKEFQRLELEGDEECPDIFPLCDSEGNRKWIFIGAHDKYLVGHFQGGKYVAEQSALPLHYGSAAYAGQTFSNLPGGRIVRMVWERSALPVGRFNGQMGVPMEIRLSSFADKYYLEATPVEEIKRLYHTTQHDEDICVTSGREYTVALNDAPYILHVKSPLHSSGILKTEIFGCAITLDFSKNHVIVGECIAPISVTKSDLDMIAVVDRCSIELFLDGGKIFVSCLDRFTVADRNLPILKLSANAHLQIRSIDISALDSIWREE